MPASTLSETKRLQSRFLPFLTSRGIVTRSVSQLPKPQIPRLRCAPLGMTKRKAKSEQRPIVGRHFINGSSGEKLVPSTRAATAPNKGAVNVTRGAPSGRQSEGESEVRQLWGFLRL